MLAGMLGGAGAVAVSAIGRVASVQAANGEPLVLGAKFATSGVATITAGSTSKVVTPGVNVTSASFVLLTPKANLGGRSLWFTTNATQDKFTIRLSSSRGTATKVAWLLLG